MQKFLVLLAVATIMFSCKNAENKNTDGEETAVAEEVMETPLVALKDFHASAAEFVDKELITNGIVDHVCRHGGKKLFLVSDDSDLHINGEERFSEDLIGSEIEVTGIVREFRVDEAHCLKMEEDNIQAHSSGEVDKEQFDGAMEQVTYYRDSMKVAGTDHLSYYSLDYVSHKEIK